MCAILKDLIHNKLKVEQIVHSWELYTVYNFSVCVCNSSCFVYCVHSQSPHSEQHIMAVFLLSLHFKDNTVCVIEHYYSVSIVYPNVVILRISCNSKK